MKLAQTRWGKRAAITAMSAMALCSGWASGASPLPASAPRPTGPQPTGTLSLLLVDSARKDPYGSSGAKRKLLVRFWYPALRVAGCAPAPYISANIRQYLSELIGIELPDAMTNSCRNAPVAAGTHPIVVISHAYTGMATDYTFLAEELASQGYVVASVAHTYETTAIEFPDGSLLKSRYGTHFRPASMRMDDQWLALALRVRVRDLSFVVDELGRLNAQGSFAGALDLSRIAVLGHSLGGEAALASVRREPRFKAAVVIDPPVTSAAGTSKPVLIFTEGREQWGALDCQLWQRLSGPRLLVNFRGAEHDTPSDAVWLGTYVPVFAVETGSMGPEKTTNAIRSYITAFLDTYLAGKPSRALLSRRSAEFTDAAITTQKQALCGEFVSR